MTLKLPIIYNFQDIIDIINHLQYCIYYPIENHLLVGYTETARSLSDCFLDAEVYWMQ